MNGEYHHFGIDNGAAAAESRKEFGLSKQD
jgi:hypothetical protein